MTLTRAMRVLGATSLAGALLFTGTGTASADQVRDGQWVNQYFNLDKVWSVSKGDGVIVAVIDSGVDATHVDLAGQVLPGYDPGGQGLVTHPTDPHGTSMASEIAGHGHGDGAGVVGLAPGVKILPIYDGDQNGNDAVPQGIHWAVDHGAKVINLSLGGGSRTASDAEKEAVAFALQHNVLVVAAAGNDGSTPVEPPGSVPGVLTVGASDKTGTVWSGSNYGPEVLVTAPGVRMVSAGACAGGQYCIADGTSDATAYVSAAAALIRAKFPNLTAGQVANRLVKSALVPSAITGAKLPDQHYGYGIIRPYEALTQDIPAGSAQGPLAATSTSPGDSATGAPAPGAAGAPVIKPARSKLPFILGGVAVLVVLVLIVIVIVVAVSRGRRRPPGGPGQPGAAPYGMAPGYPQAQQQAYGNQAPPQGYPTQQPPYGGPYQGGNQQR